MARKKLMLSLDPLPAAAQQRTSTRTPRKRTNGSLTGGGGSSGQVSKRRRTGSRNAIYDDDEFQDFDTKDAKLSDTSLKPEIKKENCKPKKPRKRHEPPKITTTQIVCIDNGMSGSGMSFAPPKTDPAVVVAEMDWPKGEGKAGKVPSQIATFEDNEDHDDFEDEDDSFFGFAIPENAVRRSYYKISLDDAGGPSGFDDPIFGEELSAKMVDPADSDKNRKAMLLAMKHLRNIHRQKVIDHMGDVSALDEIKFVYVMTFPAACSHRGKENLYSTAKEAGYLDREGDELKIISEAHTAAMAAFVGCRAQQGSQAWKTFFEKDTYITILDIGALTDDLASVKIQSNDPKLKLKEASISTGGKCGTAAIHCRFLKALADKFDAAFTHVDASELARGTRFFKDCERILKTFDGKKLDRRFKIKLELAEGIEHPDYDADTCEVFLRGYEIKKAIDSNLAYAKALLQDQWGRVRREEDSHVETTIMCGGGSLIPYVFDQLKAFCNTNNIKLIRAKDPESTVCRGGVISELDDDLLGLRVSRASFGIEVQKDGRQYIHWFLSQGDTMDTSKEVVLTYLGGNVFLS